MGPSPLSTNTTMMEQSEDAHDTLMSPGAGENSKDYSSDAAKPKTPSTKKKASFAASALTIQPTPYVNIQSPVVPLGIGSPNNERSYLLENLQRQHDRGERLSHALSNVEVRLASAQSKSEVKKWRKETTSLKSKIAESQSQEQLILLRLNDLQNEEFRQIQSAGVLPYQAAPWLAHGPQMQPWSPVTLPVSPLTPLPPGLYHPSPIVPSPMASPCWLQYSPVVASPYEQQNYYLGIHFQPPFLSEGTVAGPSRRESVSKASDSRHKATKSVDFPQCEAGSYMSRRWSLADAFSPTPKDKRMSIPNLETIWKDKEQES